MASAICGSDGDEEVQSAVPCASMTVALGAFVSPNHRKAADPKTRAAAAAASHRDHFRLYLRS